jgi:two-component system, chemotaxis family, chemotaxis protein CheY
MDPEDQTIVVADDDQRMREMIVRMLAAAGYEVLEAEDGRQAIALVRQRSCYALVTDLEMPEQEGIETIREVRQSHPDLRIVVMSGSSPENVRAAVMLGATVGLLKPFDREQLLEAVRGPA